MKVLTHALLLLAPVLFAGCGGEPGPEHAADTPTSDLPESYLLDAMPTDAQDAGAAHANVTAGANVAVRGVVGGSRKPFVEGLAAFTLVDPALASCVGDGMGCKTPWDYCCIDPQTIAENSVTVEFRDGDKTLAANPRGFHGLDHLSTVVVEGVAERDEQGNVTIVAAGVRKVD